METRHENQFSETNATESNLASSGRATGCENVSPSNHAIHDEGANDRFEWGFEGNLAEAHVLIDLMKRELQRTRVEEEKWKHLQKQNDDLRQSLQSQALVIDEVRLEGETSLQEMRRLSQRSDALCRRQLQLEESIGRLHREVRDSRSQYASLKTRQVGALAWNDRPPVYPASTRRFWEELLVGENGTAANVLKLYTAVDNLLWAARIGGPEKVIEEMPSIVTSVGQITRDLPEPWRQGRATAEVSKTLGALLAATQNFATGFGLVPISLLDAAALRLTATVRILLRTANITTGEWEFGEPETRSTRSSQPPSLQADSTEGHRSNSESLSVYCPATPFEHIADPGTWIVGQQSPWN